MLPFYGYVLGTIKDFSMHAMPSAMPPEAWWVAGLILMILCAAAMIDALSSTVPDPLIFLGLLAVTTIQGFYVSWPFASTHLAWALGAALTLWAINFIWFRLFHNDALGMGDAKWTMLAVACFDLRPVLYAWGLGAILALLWMGVVRVAQYQITRVYFAPFLFIGLITGLYVVQTQGFKP